jgi:hypothetical protein
MKNRNNKRKPLFQVADLLVEVIDGINLASGYITNVIYDDEQQVYYYSIDWNDLGPEPLNTNESIVLWRIENNVYKLYKVVKIRKKK